MAKVRPRLSVTPTVDNALIVVMAQNDGTATYTAGSGYTMPQTDAKLGVEYRLLSGGANQSQTGGFTLSGSTAWSAIIGVFK